MEVATVNSAIKSSRRSQTAKSDGPRVGTRLLAGRTAEVMNSKIFVATWKRKLKVKREGVREPASNEEFQKMEMSKDSCALSWCDELMSDWGLVMEVNGRSSAKGPVPTVNRIMSIE